jgi:organic hydroperoxide reductase OsmC/OhrA
VTVYRSDVTWTGGRAGEVRLGNGPALPFSAPPDAHGRPGTLTPEDAFVAAVNTCVALMFIWAAERMKIDLVRYECAGEATKTVALDRTESFSRVVLRPRIAVRGADEARVRRALDSALKYSLVAHSITGELIVEPEITLLDDDPGAGL